MDEVIPAVAPPTVPGLTGLTVLARGGYATVYRAEQESVGRDVAVKIENRSLDTEHDRRRFMREARAAGRMSSHPHVVDLFDAGVTADGHPYLIMELCAGSYADRLRSAPLHPAEVREVGMKIADALADAHSLGVLHRDVKPANLLMTGFGEPALADFGLAVLTEMRDLSITLEVLTPAYAPREMFRTGCEPSPAADVYSLCATLYALLRGKPPRWHEDRDPSLITLMELFDQPIPDLPGVSAPLVELLRLGMANDPGLRPTAPALRDRLAELGLQPGPVPSGEAVRVTPVPASQPDAWSMPTQPRPLEVSGNLPPVPTERPVEPVVAEGPAGAAGTERPVEPEVPQGPAGAAVPERSAPARRSWLPFAGAGAAVLVIGLLVAAATWYGLGSHRLVRAALHTGSATSGTRWAPANGSPGPGGSLSSSGPAGSSGRPPAPGSGVLGNCMLSALGAACPTSAQCFDALTVSGGVARARSLPCTQPHTWEVFALGQLPATATGVGYPAVKSDQKVSQVCSSATLMIVDMDARAWQVDVLPPSPEAFAGGDRTFRCLAGTGPNKQSAPAFGH